ncbi:MAG: SdrD B-like domain-containing protein, partial [Pseudomonadota bacterium]
MSSPKTYEFTAFTEADLTSGSDTNLNKGDTFTMPGNASTCFEVSDNDPFLSGDHRKNENATDTSYQTASITDAVAGNELGNGGQIYAEKVWYLKDQNGNTYVLIEIEQEGSGDDFFTFYNGAPGNYPTPAPGTELTVTGCENVCTDYLDYKCFDAGEKDSNPGSISGRYFNDEDCDGLEDQGEAGFTNKLIQLRNADTGEIVAETRTDQNGNYSFDNVEPGRYCVIFEQMDGFSPTARDVGSDDTIDSDLKSNGESHIFTVSPGEHEDNIDAGVKDDATASISGRYFCDDDGDAVESSGDSALAFQTVWLLDAGGNVIETTTTDANGDYSFTDLKAGDYSVRFDGNNNGGKSFVAANVGTDDRIDSDVTSVGGAGNGNTDVISLSAGQKVENIDAGAEDTTGTITGTVWCDLDCDGLQSGETRTVIAHEDFTGGADNGWWDRWTMDSDSGDTYLGGFGNTGRTSDDTAKTFHVPADTDKLEIEFDFIEVDSWDGESFYVFIDGHRIDLGDFRHNHDEGDRDIDAGNGLTVRIESQGDGKSDLGYGKDHWTDQVHKVTITVENPDNDVRIGFGSSLNQDKHDESWGVDNLKLTAVSDTTSTLGQNLVVNGDFEDNPLNNSGVIWDVESSELPGWFFVGSGKADLLEENAEGHGNATGQAIIDLDKGSILCQEVNITEAGRYVLTLDLLQNPHISANDNRIKIFIDGTEREIVRAEGQNTVTLELDLGVGTTRLDFKSLTSVNDGPGIDEIKLQKIISTSTSEPGKEGVLVSLLNEDGSAVLDGNGDPVTTTTDAAGNYTFAGVEEGNYKVSFTAPSGTAFTGQDVGSDDTIDSDVDANGLSGTITVSRGDTVDVDAGLKDAPLIDEICTFRLENHVSNGDTYGMRLDDLLGTGGYTLDFEADGAEMYATVNPFEETVHIFGTAVGSDGSLFRIDYVYNQARSGNGDDDVQVDAQFDKTNVGLIERLDQNGDVVESWDLADKAGSHPFTFRIGDGEDDQGHRGSDGNSGWGWLYVDGVRAATQDWIFELGDKIELIANDDFITVLESEGAGDTETLDSGETTILANDSGSTEVVSVNGVQGNVGEWIDLPKGRVMINSDGTVDFDADGDFEALNDGDTETVEVTYGIGNQVVENLIVNGTFEDHPALTRGSGDSIWDVFDTIPGWTTPVGLLEIQEGTHGGTPFNIVDNAVVELDSHDSADTNASMVQSVQIDEAGSYTLAFDYSPREKDGVIGATSVLNVWVNGVIIDTITSDTLGYTRETYVIDLPEGANEIGFSAGGTDDTFGALIDDVTLVGSVEETATVFITVEGEDEPVGTIEGRAFCDVNGNAMDDTGDTAIVQQLVILLNPDGSPVLDGTGNALIAFTDTNGLYSFPDVPAGDYRVGFQLPGGKAFVAQGEDLDGDGRSDDPNASDVDDAAAPVTVSLGAIDIEVQTTDVFNVGSGETVSDVDAGLFNPNSPPVAQDDLFTVEEDVLLTGNLLLDNGNGLDSDPDGDILKIIAANGDVTNQATVVTSADGRVGNIFVGESGALNFAFDQDGGFDDLGNGQTDTVSFSYTISDGNGETSNADVFVTVEGVNDLADEDETATVGEDSGLTPLVNVLDNTTDPEAGTPTVVSVGTASNGGIFTINPDGSATFDTNGEFDALNVGETTTTSVSYTVEDAAGDQVTSTVTVTVEGALEPFGAIEGRAFCDMNENGVDDAGDTAIVQQTIVLLNPDGTAALDANGDPYLAFSMMDGSYSFTNVPVGNYRVGFEVP